MNNRTHLTLLILVSLACAPALAHAQTTWHVDDDCAPPGTGTEVDPFCTIQQGVDAAADGDTVLVQPGTYTGDGNRDISLFGKTITLLSTDGPNSTVMDIEGNPQSIHRGFFLIHGESPDTIIAGFTIINGYLIGDTGGSGAGGGGGGCAFYIRESSPTIRNCIIKDNISATLSPPFPVDGRGAGIYVDGNSSAVIEKCVIADNVADRRGGGMYIGYENSTVIVRNCLLYGNSASHGGGIYNTFAGTLVSNTLIIGNTATYNGGGVHNEHGELSLANCILWGNEGSVGSQISVQGSVVTVEYSNVQGGLDAVGGCCNPVIDWGPGNIDADPLFVDPENGGFRFLYGSPCIDAGNNLAVPEGVTTDLDGGPRFLDDPDTPDTGNPDPDNPKLPIVDMGPYEYDADDCNNNGIPNKEDLANGTSEDCNDNGIPDDCELDCNGNDQQDDCDIADRTSDDCDANGVPDECDPDCNENGVPDFCDIADGECNDCDGDGIPDECDDGPGPIITLQPVSQEVEPCDLVFFYIEVDGGLLEYQWRKDGVDLGDGEGINGTNTSLLIIFAVLPGDAGSYDCVVTDFFGCATSNGAVLTVTDPCPADFDGDGIVNASDLAQLLGSWGPCPDSCIEDVPTCACPADFDRNCTVGASDLAILLGHWGPCT